MRELWAVKGPYWTLPIGVEWGETDVAKVRIGCGAPLLKIQRDELAVLLNRHGRQVVGKWYVVRARLETFAIHKPDGDPELLVEWRGPNVAVTFNNEETQSKERSEFCQAFTTHTGLFATGKTAEIVWVAFCNFALQWMLNRCRPVPMGFAELSALPMRVDWKQSLTRMERDKGKAMREEGYGRTVQGGMKPEEVSRLIKRGVCDHLLASQLTAWNESRRLIHWTLDVRPLPHFEVATKLLESERYSRRSKFGYFRSVITSMKAIIPSALKLYAEYLYQVRRPFVVLGKARNGGHSEPEPGRTMGERVEDNRSGEQVIAPDVWDLKEGQGTTLAAPVQKASVPAVPDIQQAPQNLWNPRSDVAGN